MRRPITTSLSLLALVAVTSCATSAGPDPRRAVEVRQYTARSGFEVLYRSVLVAAWETLTEDLGARVSRGDFDPLRPPIPSPADPRPEHAMTGRLSDLEQLGDVELEVRVSAPALVSADVAGTGGREAVEVRLRIVTSVDPEADRDALADRGFVAGAFWDALDVRLERRIGPTFTAGRPRQGP